MAEKLYQQIAETLAEQIIGGSYQLGDKIPSIRRHSKQFGVSIATIQAAYELLENQRLVASRPQSGYYVTHHAQFGAQEPGMLEMPFLPTSVNVRELALDIFRRCQRPGIIDFGTALPASEHLPLKQLQRIMGRLVRQEMDAIVTTEFSPGNELLRQQIARRMTDAGCGVSAQELLVTHGCQEALALALRVVAKPGDTIAVETPTFIGLLQAIEARGLKAVEIPTHPRDGISLEALQLAMEQWPIRACAVIPSYNNPLGSCMPTERRRALVELLAKRDIPLIEDDLFGDLSHDGQRPPACKAFDTAGRVLYCSSVSKSIASGLRVGWVTPGRYQAQMENLKSFFNVGDPTITQLAVAELMANGGYDRHIRRIRKSFAVQLQQAAYLISRHFPSDTTITRPSGGYILWVGLPQEVDALTLYNRALKAGIGIVPGMLFSPSGKYANFIRINCALNWTREVEEALVKLANLVKSNA